MNILLIAECNKRALVETRRVLDQFAERKGERTWQTAITLEGLKMLRKLLRKTARRNTAVACHWIRSTNHTELLWIVGNVRRFNVRGCVPTNRTERNILRTKDENPWHSLETFSLLAAIAGLFHDIGKANRLFQRGLKEGGPRSQPYRHEWVSLKLFQAFVAKQDDKGWLTALSQITPEHDDIMLSTLSQDESSPFNALPPLAQVVAWLIVSHHRLPTFQSKSNLPEPQLEFIDHWLTKIFSPVWNALNHHNSDWDHEERKHVWQFPHGTPMRSVVWCEKARKFAGRALKLPSLYAFGHLSQRTTVHMARLVLMLADHHYSASTATTGWQDRHYPVWANTDRITGKLKQQLDEHCIGVAQNAFLLGRSLPHLRDSLPAITRHKRFRQRSESARFRWQDRAFDLACAVKESTQRNGFFGINMASTGCGKTFANARIMYGLADESVGCRFSVALGLRTLTLQTGDALRQRLTLEQDDLAVLVGSQAVQELHERGKKAAEPSTGSESAASLFAEHCYVNYEGSLDDGRLKTWLEKSPTLHQLLSAPVLVTTIDHLMPATESLRGGHQIAPMLRLLTADLVLDEPDDFGLNDLPALCRLVNWVGLLGGRVLLSSATLPPALIRALFEAYRDGRKGWQAAYGEQDAPQAICCAWFDEYESVSSEHYTGDTFALSHQDFVSRRVVKLDHPPFLRWAKVITTASPSTERADACIATAQVMHSAMFELHNQHQQRHESGKSVSLGLIRMANIKPLVTVARHLMMMPSPEGFCVHYCVYHSQHPLVMRSHLESRLDAALMRHDAGALWHVDEIRHAIECEPESHHLFVVLATPVAEVGRDHDYDWMIAEPSSMRSIIQLAGRLLRHRQHTVSNLQHPNFYLLSQNVRALQKREVAFCRPGFESTNDELKLPSHDLQHVFDEKTYRHISATPRIVAPTGYKPLTFVNLEHKALNMTLFSRKNNTHPEHPAAAIWWKSHPHWCGELQRRTPFRQSDPEQRYCCWLEDENDSIVFMTPDESERGWKETSTVQAITLKLADGVKNWVDMDYATQYLQLADEKQKELSWVSKRFGEINLRKEESEWYWHPSLGVFGALD